VSLPPRNPWSTCTATGASPASVASASSADESAPPEQATITGDVRPSVAAANAARQGAIGSTAPAVDCVMTTG
jgi:hypothetical protein